MTDDNLLTGPIPTEIGNISALRYLILCEWASMNRVKNDSHYVRLSHTFLVLLDSPRMIASNALPGPIPTEIGNLLVLRYLQLCEWASINGVKKEFHFVRLSHTFLVLLDSSRMTDNNELTGPIPTEIGNLSEIEYLYLREWASINGMKKELHPVRLSHTFLILLDSSRMTDYNELTGPIPTEIGNISVLEYLFLSE
jgi:hypothetical protein